jgi:hypothetical protein
MRLGWIVRHASLRMRADLRCRRAPMGEPRPVERVTFVLRPNAVEAFRRRLATI